MKKLIRLSSMPYKDEDISHYIPITQGHNHVSIDPHERFIAKKIPKHVTLPKYVYNEENPDEPILTHEKHDKTPYMLREAQREESASKIAKLGNFNIPETIIHSHSPDEHVTVLSRYLKGATPLSMYQPSTNNHNLQHDPASNNRLALHDVEPDSVVGSAILNYVVNHRDAHLNNFLVHEGKLVPIDFGASFDLPADEPNINRHSNVLDEDFLRFNKNKPLNKNLLEGYIKNKTAIIEEAIKVSQLYPSYIRDNVLSNLARRLEKLQQVYEKENPNIQDLRQLLISQPSYVAPEVPQTNIEPIDLDRYKQDSIKTHITTGKGE